ncbi:hypothetical protein GW916_06930 [bacterium]|nr:hypothetical protein [bacterium]
MKFNSHKKILLVIGLSMAFSMGCANHHCRIKKEGAQLGRVDTSAAKDEKVLVAKPDGSKQCQDKSGRSLDRMAADLSGIEIFRQFKADDGMMRIQVCGAPTGTHNVYEILKSDEKKALDVGFQVWKGPKK